MSKLLLSFFYRYGAVRVEATEMPAGGGGLVIKRAVPTQDTQPDAGPWTLQTLRGYDDAAEWPGAGATTGFAYDYEAPLGILVRFFLVPKAVTKVSLSDPYASSTIITPEGLAWLRDLYQPVLSQMVTVLSTDPKDRPARQTVYDIVGKKTAVVVWDVREARQGTITIFVRNNTEDLYRQTRRDKIEALIDTGRPLLFSMCQSKGFDPCYLAVADVRFTRYKLEASWKVELDYFEVDNPLALGVIIPAEFQYLQGLDAPVPGATYAEWDSVFADYFKLVTGDMGLQVTPFAILLNATNFATNPNAEAGQDGAWYSNDPAKWVVSAPTAGAISGTRSVMVTRQANVLGATNLVPNPRFVGTPLTAAPTPQVAWWIPARAAVAADPAVKRNPTGPQSMKVSCNAAGGSYVLTADTLAVNRIPLSSTGAVFTMKGSVYPDPATLGAANGGRPRFNLIYYQYDAANVLIGATSGTVTACPVGQWTDFSQTFTPNAAAVTVRWGIIASMTDVSTGAVFWVGEPLLVMGTYAGAYFDGSTPDTGVNDYRWTGTVNASTSEKRSVPVGDLSSASLYFTADASTPFAVTPGVPITFAVDVKVEQANRQITGYFSWIGDGLSTPVTIPAGPAGSVVRFVMTGTPPAGVTSVYPVVTVDSTSGPALNGERTWWDNLYVGDDAAGTYFDGSTPANGGYTYGWTGAVNASRSERYRLSIAP